MKVSIKKLESLRYPTVKPYDPMVISFESMSACDGQTDGQTRHLWLSCAEA